MEAAAWHAMSTLADAPQAVLRAGRDAPTRKVCCHETGPQLLCLNAAQLGSPAPPAGLGVPFRLRSADDGAAAALLSCSKSCVAAVCKYGWAHAPGWRQCHVLCAVGQQPAAAQRRGVWRLPRTAAIHAATGHVLQHRRGVCRSRCRPQCARSGPDISGGARSACRHMHSLQKVLPRVLAPGCSRTSAWPSRLLDAALMSLHRLHRTSTSACY